MFLKPNFRTIRGKANVVLVQFITMKDINPGYHRNSENKKKQTQFCCLLCPDNNRDEGPDSYRENPRP